MRLILILIFVIFSGWVQAQDESGAFLDALESSKSTSVLLPQGDPRQGRLIILTTPIGTTFQAFEAGPDDATVGILLLHDRWGLTDAVRQRVMDYAHKGYKALAIDVFDQRISKKAWLASEIVGAADTEAVKVNVLAGVDYLVSPNRKLVTVGWGFGGWQSYQAALNVPEKLAAVVVGYSPVFSNLKEVHQAAVPMLAIFAQDDGLISAAQISGFHKMKADAYKNTNIQDRVVFQHYMIDADRGFVSSLDPAYNRAAAKDAWAKVDQFLANYVE